MIKLNLIGVLSILNSTLLCAGEVRDIEANINLLDKELKAIKVERSGLQQLQKTKKVAEEKTILHEVEAIIGRNQKNGVGYREFFFPKYHGLPVSYCSQDTSVCGLPIANQYCKLLGYHHAVKMSIEPNVGHTRYLGGDVACRGFACASFKLITCEKSLQKTPTPEYYYRMKRFILPRFENYRVDWCYRHHQGCGKRAADAFCRHQGYLQAKTYSKATHTVATRSIGSEALCFGHQCNSFDSITCYR